MWWRASPAMPMIVRVGVGRHDLGQGDVGVDEAVRRHRRPDDGEQVRLDPEVLAAGRRDSRRPARRCRQLVEDPPKDGVEVGEQRRRRRGRAPLADEVASRGP